MELVVQGPNAETDEVVWAGVQDTTKLVAAWFEC
jgi:hypothetical protein